MFPNAYFTKIYFTGDYFPPDSEVAVSGSSFEFLVGVYKDLQRPRNWVMFGPVGLSRRL